MALQAFNTRDGPRRLAFVWRNNFTTPTTGMFRHSFSLAREGLSGVGRLYVLRATVLVQDPNFAVAERQLLGLTVNRSQQEVVWTSDPAISGGEAVRSTLTCLLHATHDGGLGSYAITYAPSNGRHLVVDNGEQRTADITTADFEIGFPLWPELPELKVMEVLIEVEAE